jgi:transposase InsO family protein
MSRNGDCYDNAPMESFSSTLKRERVNRRKYWSRDEAAIHFRDYIVRFYNLHRRHSLRALTSFREQAEQAGGVLRQGGIGFHAPDG